MDAALADRADQGAAERGVSLAHDGPHGDRLVGNGELCEGLVERRGRGVAKTFSGADLGCPRIARRVPSRDDGVDPSTPTTTRGGSDSGSLAMMCLLLLTAQLLLTTLSVHESHRQSRADRLSGTSVPDGAATRRRSRCDDR